MFVFFDFAVKHLFGVISSQEHLEFTRSTELYHEVWQALPRAACQVFSYEDVASLPNSHTVVASSETA